MVADDLNPKLIITKYFDKIINDIDIDTETLIYNSSLKHDINDDHVSYQNELNEIRTLFIKEIRAIQQANLRNYETNKDEIDSKISKSNKNDIGTILYVKFCFYLKKEIIRCYSDYNKLGILILIDLYYSDKQIEALK